MRTLANIGLSGGFAIGEDGWGDEMNSNLLMLSTLVQGGVLDAVAAVPGAPAQGDVYILTAEPNKDAVAVYDDAVWHYFEPLEGWWLYNRATDKYMTFKPTGWEELTTGGGGGGDSFPPLADNAGKVLAVNLAEDGVEWITPSGGGGGGGGGGGSFRGAWAAKVGSFVTFDSGVLPFDFVAQGNRAVTFPNRPDSVIGTTKAASFSNPGSNADAFIRFYARKYGNDDKLRVRYYSEGENNYDGFMVLINGEVFFTDYTSDNNNSPVFQVWEYTLTDTEVEVQIGYHSDGSSSGGLQNVFFSRIERPVLEIPYVYGDTVTYGGSIYFCVIAGTAAVPGTNNNWAKFGA